MRQGVKDSLFYTDGEMVEEKFETLTKCLEYINDEIVKKKEYTDRIIIDIS